MGNIQSYDKDFVIGSTGTARAVAEQLNMEGEKKMMDQAWKDVKMSLGDSYGVVGKFNGEMIKEQRWKRQFWVRSH